MPKRPSFQFYPGDWVRDPVAGCSLAAQGLWLRMMIVAHDADRYGHLEQHGSPMPSDAISRRCGCESVVQYEALLTELFQAGVPSRTPQGVIYSRRMVRDEELRQTRASGGADSLKNPRVPRPSNKDGEKDIPKDVSEDAPKDAPKDTHKDGDKDTSEPPHPEPEVPSSDESLPLSLRVSPSSSSSSSKLKVKTSCEAPSQNDGTSRGNSAGAKQSKKRKSETDPRYTPTQGLLAAAFHEVCSASESAPWDGHSAKELSDWLASHTLDLSAIETLVRNVAHSEDAAELLRDPAHLIPRLRKYHVPLDRFGKVPPRTDGRKASQVGVHQPMPPQPVDELRLPLDLDRGAGRVWEEVVLAELAKQIDPHSFETWLKPTHGEGMKDGILWVSVPTPDFYFVRDKYYALIRELLPCGVDFKFVAPTPKEASEVPHAS